MHEEHYWTLIRGSDSNTQLLWILVILNDYLIFTERHEIENVIFELKMFFIKPRW